MEHEVFLLIVASCCMVILLYGYRTLWARYRNSQSPTVDLGPPPPPFKRTVSGEVDLKEEEGNQLNEKMLQWQKMYQMATDSSAEEPKPELVSEEQYSQDVTHLADVIMPGEKPLSYREYLERKLEARNTLRPIKKAGRSAVTPEHGRFC